MDRKLKPEARLSLMVHRDTFSNFSRSRDDSPSLISQQHFFRDDGLSVDCPPSSMDTQLQHSTHFLYLPLEVQRLVFDKFYEEEWTVIGILTDPPKQRLRYELESAFIPPLYVSKHFWHEARRAIRRSRSGHYKGVISSTLSETPKLHLSPQPTVFDESVRSIDIKDQHLSQLRGIKLQFPNLANVRVVNVAMADYSKTRNHLHRTTFFDILRGVDDKTTVSIAREDFYSKLVAPCKAAEIDVGCVPPLYGMTVSYEIDAFKLCMLRTAGFSGVRKCGVILQLEHTDQESWISRRWAEVSGKHIEDPYSLPEELTRP